MTTTRTILAAAVVFTMSGCAVGLHTNLGDLFPGRSNANAESNNGTTASAPASSSSSGSSARAEAPAAPADPAAERHAIYDPLIKDVDAFIAKIPEVKDREALLDDMTSTYPSTEFVKTYKDLYSHKSMRSAADAETPEWKAVEAKYAELEQKVAEALVLPADVYKDKDAKQVKKAFTDEAKKWTKHDVVAVSLRYDDWGRKSGSDWQGDSLVNFDNGYMKGFVVVEGDAGHEVWMFDLRRDYLDGGKLKNDVYVPYKVADISADNLKKK